MTKGEMQAILFVAVSMLAGGLVLLAKQFHSDFLPDLGPAARDGRLNAGIRAQSAQPAGNARAAMGLSSVSGGDTGGERATGNVPYARAASPGTGTGYPVAGVPSKTATSDENLQVPINTAQASELQKLPGIGPTLAERIIAFRQRSGSFASVEELLEVKGIGPATLERLRPFVDLR